MTKLSRLAATVLFGIALIVCANGCGYVNSSIQKAKCETCSGSGTCVLCEGNGKGIFYGKCGVCDGDGLCDECSATGINVSD